MANKNAPRLDCGWRIDSELRAEVIAEIHQWRPRDEIGRRDKRICELALIHDMNAAQIERLNDPQFVRYNKNRKSLGYPLSAKGIIEIIYKKFPRLRRKRGYSVHGNDRKRLNLRRDFETLTEGKPKICAICGSVEDLRLHHIVPVDHGGTNDPINLIFLCETCHYSIHRYIYKTWGEAGTVTTDEPIKEEQHQKPTTEDIAAAWRAATKKGRELMAKRKEKA